MAHALALFFSFIDLVISAVAFKSSVRETAPIVWLVWLEILKGEGVIAFQNPYLYSVHKNEW